VLPTNQLRPVSATLFFALLFGVGCTTTPTPHIAMPGNIEVDGPNAIAKRPARLATGKQWLRHDQQGGRTWVVHIVQLAFQSGEAQPVLLGEAEEIGIRPLAVAA
jgi:hypothetical protein